MKKWLNTKEAMEYTGMGEESLKRHLGKAMIQFPPGTRESEGTRRYWSTEKIDELMRKALKKMG